MSERIKVNSKKPVSIKENLISHKRKTDFRSNSSPVNRILYLQRTIGNQAVQRLIKSGTLQAKLRIGQPGDKYEQEADRVADAVMRMPEPGVQREVEPEEEEEETLQSKPLVDQITPLVQRQVEEEKKLRRKPVEKEEEELQAKATSGSISEVDHDLESNIQSLTGGGQSLSKNERAFFEPRFGQDFSQVRLHTNSRAAESARAVNARAFTVGRDMVFGAGQYASGTSEGRRLMAHELTHVIQQGRASHSSKSIYEQHQSSIHGSFVSREPSSRYFDTIRRVVWYPNKDTGKDSYPWGTGTVPKGDILEAATDAGTSINTWSPHDKKTYWCHGFTFGGSTAKGGPYSIWGQTVPTVLKDDGWKRVDSCVATADDILVFYEDSNVKHTGIVVSVSAPDGQVDEGNSKLQSKLGQQGLSTKSWRENISYGKYKCFSKNPASGTCGGYGTNELH